MTVVLATNRGGPFLADALQSVFDQTYERVEVIVIDDGSPDPDTIASDVCRAGPARLERCSPRGVSAARNFGVALGTGDLLAFIDDDDRWHPERLRRGVESLVAAPEAVVSYCQMQTIDAAGTILVPGDQRAARDEHDIFRGVTGVMLPNLIIRRDVFERIGGFDAAYRQAEDLDLVLKAAQLGPFAFVEEVLVDYRHHEQNTTRRHRELAAAIRTVVRDRRHDAIVSGRQVIVDDLHERLRANDRFAAWSAARAARAAAARRDLAAAVSEIWWAARFAPLAPLYWVLHRIDRRADG